MTSNSEIVYTYCYKGLITITRTKNGTWHYAYTISNIIERLNKKRSSKDRYRVSSGMDLFEVGQILGYKINDLLKYCQKSYGDKPENYLDIK
jgi:hypothetical protein